MTGRQARRRWARRGSLEKQAEVGAVIGPIGLSITGDEITIAGVAMPYRE